MHIIERNTDGWKLVGRILLDGLGEDWMTRIKPGYWTILLSKDSLNQFADVFCSLVL